MTIIDILKDCGIQHRLNGEDKHARRGWVNIECPECGTGTGKFHLGINLHYGYANCWRCGHKSLFDVLQAITTLTQQQIREMLHGMERPLTSYKPREHTGKLMIPGGVGRLLMAHKNYLKARGFDPAELEKLWKIQGIGIAPRLAWRIFIPFIHRGETVSWTARSIGDKAIRYISAAEHEQAMNAKHLLYGEDYARHRIIVVEGPTDVWKIGPGAVATCGVSITRRQLHRISKYHCRYICLDNEPAARHQAHELCDALRCLPGSTHLITLDAKDAGSASAAEIRELRRLIA